MSKTMLRLPKPPSEEELAAHIPQIHAVAKGVSRPFWSVMIPTYNAGDFFRRTLESVLAADLGPDQMQIEVVDGCSTTDDPEQVVRELGKGRVAFHRLSENRGPANTFNVALARSRGRWVHVLHGDDLVMPGFYAAYTETIRKNRTATAVCGQAVMMDRNERWMGIHGPVPPIGGGVIPDFAERQATRQLLLAPSIVASRAAYEAIGGFSDWFGFVIDWDMWARLGHFGPVACVDRPYSLYRRHGQSHTVKSQFAVSGANAREYYSVIAANLRRLNRPVPREVESEWRSRLARQAEDDLWVQSATSAKGRFNQASWAWMLQPSGRRLLQLAKSWLKYRLSDVQNAA
jgi:glycosyltransferase involved in cell wall biosynthesis